MIRLRVIAATLMLAGLFVGEASAQTWSFDGVTFAKRDGWCAKTAEQNDGRGGKTAAYELRPCGKDFPFMSLAVAVRGAAPANMDQAIPQIAAQTASEDGKTRTDTVFKRRDPNCTRVSHKVVTNPFAGIAGFDLTASYACPALGPDPSVMRNFTAYAQRKNGDVWVVAFDHPDTDISESDQAMIRSAVAAIAAN